MLKECVPAAGIARLAHSPPLRVDVAHPGNGGGPAPVQASVPRRIPIATDSLVRFCPETNGSKTYAGLLSKGTRRPSKSMLHTDEDEWLWLRFSRNAADGYVFREFSVNQFGYV